MTHSRFLKCPAATCSTPRWLLLYSTSLSRQHNTHTFPPVGQKNEEISSDICLGVYCPHLICMEPNIYPNLYAGRFFDCISIKLPAWRTNYLPDCTTTLPTPPLNAPNNQQGWENDNSGAEQWHKRGKSNCICNESSPLNSAWGWIFDTV